MPRLADPARTARRILAVAAVVLGGVMTLLWVAGIFDRDAAHVFPARGRRAPLSAVFFSGDMGLRLGMGAEIAPALAARGIATIGYNSPTLFAHHRTRAETDAIVAGAVRRALASTGTSRVVVIGQSFGADVLQAGLSALPADLRRHIAAAILIVPGRTVFLRADPTTLAYRSTPDIDGRATARTIDWTQLTCIYGREERDSLCPMLRGTAARVVAMPGGHFLHNDHAALNAQILVAIARAG